MIPTLRRAYNRAFTDARYRELVDVLETACGVPIKFRVSETPCFFPATLVNRLAAAAHGMIDALLADSAYQRAADAIVPPPFRVANSETQPTFVQVDFGLLRTGPGDDDVEGRLVELQAFPSIYGFQQLLTWVSLDRCADVAELAGVSASGLERGPYLETVGRAITGGHDPAEVVLMEIDPRTQKTRPDFAMTERLWGVRAVDVRDVIPQGGRLFYRRDGALTRIRRVYNRLIPDDVVRLDLVLPFDYRDDLDVEWTGGPDWFFRLSKFSIPHLRHPWVPRTMFLSEAGPPFTPGDPGWLLKPLFSYAGGGIVFGPTAADLAAIPAVERHLYLLQERVPFTPVIETPEGPTQAEIRMMFVRDDAGYRFVLALVRMGRGRMMGVDHNRGLRWVGAAAALIGRRKE